MNNIGFFASLDYALFSIALVLESISSRWLKALPAFSDVSYELQLMARAKFLPQNRRYVPKRYNIGILHR